MAFFILQRRDFFSTFVRDSLSACPESMTLSLRPYTFPPYRCAALDLRRRRGIARELIAACERVSRRWGQRELWLHVDVLNDTAARMYSALGYEKAGEDPWWSSERRILLRKALPAAAGGGGGGGGGAGWGVGAGAAGAGGGGQAAAAAMMGTAGGSSTKR